jgi:glyceraldehyde 3-phosphate dehydrogenase
MVDGLLTQAIEKDGAKLYRIVSWYDNEMSYVSQLIRTTKKFIGL